MLEGHSSSSEWTVKNDPISEKLEMLKLKVKEKRFSQNNDYEKKRLKALHKEISTLRQQRQLLSSDVSISVKPEKVNKDTQYNSDDFKESLNLTPLISDNDKPLQEKLMVHNNIKVKEYQEKKTIELHTKVFKESIETSGKTKKILGKYAYMCINSNDSDN